MPDKIVVVEKLNSAKILIIEVAKIIPISHISLFGRTYKGLNKHNTSF